MDSMDPKKLHEGSDPKVLGAYLAGLPVVGMHDHGPGGMAMSVREDDYKGHHIVIRTSYSFEVDGRPLDVPIMVDNDGNIHCHSLPNYQFLSAVELVRQLIDTFPKEFGAEAGPAPRGAQGPQHPQTEGGH